MSISGQDRAVHGTETLWNEGVNGQSNRKKVEAMALLISGEGDRLVWLCARYRQSGNEFLLFLQASTWPL